MCLHSERIITSRVGEVNCGASSPVRHSAVNHTEHSDRQIQLKVNEIVQYADEGIHIRHVATKNVWRRSSTVSTVKFGVVVDPIIKITTFASAPPESPKAGRRSAT